MSLYSFIAFPREVDKSCLKSNIDETKSVKVKDLKGTEWENEYIGVPDDSYVYLGDISDSDELQIYENDSQVTFKKVFENQFIYSMNAEFIVNNFDPLDLLDVNKRAENAGMGVDEYVKTFEKETGISVEEDIKEIEVYLKKSKDYIKESKQRDIKHVARCRQQLYDLVKFNTVPGEFVEIFSGWVRTSNPIRLGPPKEKRMLDLGEVLTSELLDIQDKLKIEIYNN